VKFYVEFFVDEVLYFLFLLRLPVTKEFQEVFALVLAEFREPAAPETRHQKTETTLVPPACPACSCPKGRADIVGSVFQRCSLVDPLDEAQPLSEFLISRFRKDSVEIVLIEVTGELLAAISRHTLITDAASISSPNH
jgi:hypothetical protein